MCTDYKDVAAAAVADAMSVIYEATSLDPGSMVAVRLINTLFMETIIALDEMDDDDEWPEDYNPEAN
jgi:hypothetical protein